MFGARPSLGRILHHWHPKPARYFILVALLLWLGIAYAIKYQAESDLKISTFVIGIGIPYPGSGSTQ